MSGSGTAFSLGVEGVRVLGMTHHIAGPHCTKLLAMSNEEYAWLEEMGHIGMDYPPEMP